MTKKHFVLNTFIITLTSFFLKGAGMFFKVYLSNKIGAEGMGLYQLIFSVYIFLIALTSSGVTIAVSSIVSCQIDKCAQKRIRYIVRCALFYVSVISFAVCLIMNFFADEISVYFVKDIRCTECIKILCISLAFIGFSAVFKGYFTAKNKVYHISNSQILEDFIKIFTVMFIFSKYGVKDIVTSCKIIMISIVLGEAASCLFLFTFYKKSVKGVGILKDKLISNKLYSTIFTISLGGIISSFLHTTENVLIPSGLLKYGNSSNKALSLYGELKGMAMPLLLFPSSVISAFSTLLVPEVSKLGALNQNKKINYTIYRVFQITLVISILIMGIFVSYSDKISMLIYKNKEVGTIMKILSFYLPFMYLDGVIFAFLTGLGEQKTATKIMSIDSFIRVLLVYFLVPKFGFYGIIIMLYISNFLTPVWGGIELLRKTGAKIDLIKLLFLPSLSVLFAIVFSKVFSGKNLMINMVCVSVIYIVFIRCLNVVTSDDVKWMLSVFKVKRK